MTVCRKLIVLSFLAVFIVDVTNTTPIITPAGFIHDVIRSVGNPRTVLQGADMDAGNNFVCTWEMCREAAQRITDKAQRTFTTIETENAPEACRAYEAGRDCTPAKNTGPTSVPNSSASGVDQLLEEEVNATIGNSAKPSSTNRTSRGTGDAIPVTDNSFGLLGEVSTSGDGRNSQDVTTTVPLNTS